MDLVVFKIVAVAMGVINVHKYTRTSDNHYLYTSTDTTLLPLDKALQSFRNTLDSYPEVCKDFAVKEAIRLSNQYLEDYHTNPNSVPKKLELSCWIQ